MKIHVFGASGAGTTTLAKAIGKIWNLRHLDTDSFFWEETSPPRINKREPIMRDHLLREILSSNESWVLSGSLCGWGDFTIPMFDLVVFRWIPKKIRIQRLKKRERERYGPEIERKKHPRNKIYLDFIQWAKGYDSGGMEMRSRVRHEAWIKALFCPVLKIEGDRTVQECIEIFSKYKAQTFVDQIDLNAQAKRLSTINNDVLKAGQI